MKIEASFLKGCGYQLGKSFCHKSDNYKNKDVLFNGLYEAITTLCELDNIENVMDYTKLFESQTESSSFKITA